MGQQIGKDTLFEYLTLLEEVNFVRLVPLFDYSLKKQTVNPRKIYPIDTGLVTAVSFQFFCVLLLYSFHLPRVQP